MSLKKFIQFGIIKFNRYALKRKFLQVFAGPLKGYYWSLSYNYDYITGIYEDGEALNDFCSWLKPNTVFYDLGANVGYYAFIANRYITTGKIYSFEPVPENIKVFKEHLELNKEKIKFNNINLLPYAIADLEKEVIFSNNTTTIEGNTYIKSSSIHQSSQDMLKVKAYSIDSLLALGYETPDVIKIDVEGAEFDVLMGAKETIIKYRPNILLATHDCHLPGVQAKCVTFLEDLGYELIHLNSEDKIIAGLDDYIALPKTRASLTPGTNG